MRLLVSSLLESIPGLLNVVALLLFVFAIFGILGLQLWAGLLHTRCRLTSVPVKFVGGDGLQACQQPNSDACRDLIANSSASAGSEALLTNSTLGLSMSSLLNSSLFEPCLPGAALIDDSWTKDSSPWSTPQPCFWPVDPEDESFCTVGEAGLHRCPNAAQARWCGSDYDFLGNPRFSSESVVEAGTFAESLNWGFIVFDNIGIALLAIFQAITLEGWTTIMYHTMDVYSPVVSGAYFIVLVLFGSFFLLNLTLAVIWDNFSKGQSEEQAEEQKKSRKHSAKRKAAQQKLAHFRAAARVAEAAGDVKGPLPSGTKTPSSSGGVDTPAGDSGGLTAPAHPDGQQLAGIGFASQATDNSVASGGHADASGGGAPLSMIGASSADPENRAARAQSRQQDASHGDQEAPMTAPHAGLQPPTTAVAAGTGSGTPSASVAHRSPPNTDPGTKRGGGAAAHPGAQRRSPTMSYDLRERMETAGRSTPGKDSLKSGGSPVPMAGRGAESKGVAALGRLSRSLGEAELYEAQAKLQAIKASRREHGMRSSPQPSKGKTVERADSSTSVETAASSGSAAVRRYGSWVTNKAIPPPTRLAEVRRREVWLNAGWCRRWVHGLVRDDLFTGSVTALILVNTGVLAADRYPITTDESNVLEIINFVCTVLFALEMILKLIGLGPPEYARDAFNLFDAAIVVMSLVELIVTPPAFLTPEADLAGQSSAISALRTFRLFRVFKLAASWPSLRNLLTTILKTVNDIANFAILLMLFMYIFALVGMQFFANQLCFAPDTGLQVPSAGQGPCDDGQFDRPRSNFDNLTNAIATVFMILTGENWNSVMYDAWRAVGGGAVVYFILLVVLGNFIVLNLFLAILLGNFEGIDLSGKQVGPDHKRQVSADGPGAKPKRNLSRSVSSLLSSASQRASSTLGWVAATRRAEEDEERGVQRRQSRFISDAFDDTPYYEDLPWYRKLCAVVSGHVHRRPAGMPSRGDGSRRVVPIEGQAARSASHLPSSPPPIQAHVSPEQSESPSPGAGVGTVPGVARRRPGPPPRRPGAPPGAPAGAPAPKRPTVRIIDTSPGASSRPVSVHVRSASSSTRTPSSDAGQASGVGHSHPKPPGPARRVPKRARGGRGARRGSVMDRILSPLGISNQTKQAKRRRQTMMPTPAPPPIEEKLQGRALCCLEKDNAFRRHVFDVVSNVWFDRGILLLIFISSVTLAIDNPLLDPNGTTAIAIGIIDIILTTLFAVEMVLKIVALGFFMHEGAYLRSGWNILDFCIVIISIAALALDGNSALSSLRALRALRALRPLRVVSRRPGLRLVVNALIASMKSIANVVLVCAMFFLIFGILTVNYFKGSFFACGGSAFESFSPAVVSLITYPLSWNDVTPFHAALFNASSPNHAAARASSGIPAEATPQDFLSSYTSKYLTSPPVSRTLCDVLGGEWEAVLPSRFDNILQAIGTLFEMSTTEGWADVMWQGVDARGVEMQPVRDFRPGWVWFFIAFMVVGSFFAVNLFVGVVIDNFNQMKIKHGGNVLLTEEQKEWVRTQEAMLKLQPYVRPPPATNALQQWSQDVIMHPFFEAFIMVCIILNTFTMAIEFWGQPTEYALALVVINYIFAVLFLAEAVVKLIALRMTYFSSSWNIFDFTIVLASVVGIIVRFATGVDIGSVATVIRTFRIGRVLRIVKRARRLNQLFKTLMLTLPSLGNIGALLFLLLFIYAVMGVQLFAAVQHGEFIDRHANFETFGNALLVLMRASTGESWNGIMYEAAETDKCTDLDNVPYDEKKHMCGFSDNLDTCAPLTGCGSVIAYVYFNSFTIFVTFVFLNLLIAVVIEGFSETDDTGMRLTDEQFDQFREVWVLYDPQGVGEVPSTSITKMLQQLPEPLGFGAYEASDTELQARMHQLDLRVTANGMAKFHDMGQALAKRVFEETLRGQGKEFTVPQDLVWEEDSDSEEDWRLEHYLAATVISRFMSRVIVQRRALRSLALQHGMTDEELHQLSARGLEAVSPTPPPSPTESADEGPHPSGEEDPDPAPRKSQALSRRQRRSLAVAMSSFVSLSRPFSLPEEHVQRLRARQAAKQGASPDTPGLEEGEPQPARSAAERKPAAAAPQASPEQSIATVSSTSSMRSAGALPPISGAARPEAAVMHSDTPPRGVLPSLAGAHRD